MLFWKFFFCLFIADLVFTFAWLTYNGLVVMAMAALFGKRKNSGNTDAENPPIKWPMLLALSPFLILAGVYIVTGWAAFVARYASACSQIPGVEQHWLYYLFGFCSVGGPLLAGESKDERDWRIFIAAIAYVIFAISPGLAERPYGWVLDRLVESPAAEAIERGWTAATKEDWDLAVTEYTKAIRLDPKAAEAYYGRGVVYERNREYHKAIADCTEAIRLDPKYVNAYRNRGAAYGNKGEYDTAIADYNEAIDLDPTEANAYCNRDAVYGKKREWNKAIADLSEAVRLNPKYVSAYFQRGCAYLGKAYPSGGGLIGAFASGFLELGKDDFNRAIADLTEAIRLKPDYAEAYYCRGETYGALGENSKAQADFAEAKRLGFKP